MTHWGWDNTDEEYSTETDSDCEYIYVSSSSSESEIKDNHAICEKEKVQEPKKEGELSSSKGAKSEALQRTYSNFETSGRSWDCCSFNGRTVSKQRGKRHS